MLMFNKLSQFLNDVKFEMSKVSWPTWEELRSSTYVVLSLSMLLIVFLFFIDLFLARILNIIL